VYKMAKSASSSVSFSESNEFYRQLFDNNGHMFEGRNPKGAQETEVLPESLSGYCQECGGLLVYPHGVAVCPDCHVEYPTIAPTITDNLIPKKSAASIQREEMEIYYREREEKDVTGNL
jgi:hypothetical protein